MARGTNEEEELDQQEESTSKESSNGFFGELKDVASEAALAVLAPVAKKAATGAAKYAVKKGPELLEDTVMPMLEDAGGPKELVGDLFSADGPAGGLVSKLTGGGDDDGGGGAGDGTGKGRRMPVQQAVDVAAPIEIVYDQWTQFEDYPKFMHRVERVEQSDDAHVVFHSKMWGINRKWEAEIVEQRPDERVVWKSVDGLSHTGVVTFHDLADRLTRVELNIDVDPSGPLEKIARGARFVKRAARADLKRFKAYVEMHEDETGAWRGEIQDGDVVSESDEGREDEYEDEPEAEYEDEQPEAEYDDEPEAEQEDEDEPEAEYQDEDESEDYDDEEEDEEEPEKRKAPARSGGRTRSKSSSSRSSSRKRGSSNGGDPKRSSSSGSRSKSKSSSSSSRSRSRGSSKKSGSSSSQSSRRSSSSSKGGGRSSKSGSSRSKSSSGRGRSS